MNSMLGLAVGVCGAAFLAYCIYFHSKGRSDPNFKKKLRDRRKSANEAGGATLLSHIKSIKDNESLKKFFLQEIQLGEEMLIQGDTAKGVEHLVNAVVVCKRSEELLNILNSTLPPEVFQLLTQQLALVKSQGNLGVLDSKVLGMEEDVE